LIAIRDFLEAEDHQQSRPWRTAKLVSEKQFSDQMRADGLGALPWGAVSAVIRHVVG